MVWPTPSGRIFVTGVSLVLQSPCSVTDKKWSIYGVESAIVVVGLCGRRTRWFPFSRQRRG